MRPRLVLFGDSITELSFASGGWGAALTDRFARQVLPCALLPWPWRRRRRPHVMVERGGELALI